MSHDSPASRRLHGRHAGAVVSRLTHKYTEILTLRDAHARGEDPPDVRQRLRALAARFPGALRELDRLPREAIVEKLAQLARAEGAASLAPWMIAIDRYHRWLRVGLRRRSALGPPPSDGRIVPRVLAIVAVELSLTTSEVEDLLGLPSRRRSPPS
ncbi:MAG: hypothetical protein J0L92_10310 [Deltaproteobacteria bacterium]|nr:hypothetical protein [Deltaproteobacteria bacterium]